ncbi:MAG: type II toxin-antitoxin system VapC family toxin [Candidatus Devosia phytovorans]|uniref:Type II toxin-antitoxin system VapC family toxin n=1 Tax=Candidatus Devosia phytovorans TaxID=3121372 RepID=A0AAJ5VS35_9HYPH|nr:type II toxin-antitoxin system VapC family toxin [Devosia sp.]WEK03100.1 MAG: type II toxin-antitoxin system VapC family toxin [Devosia sp.]
MRVFLDTHILLWASAKRDRLPLGVAEILEAATTVPCFSVVNVWEVAIKAALGRSDFTVDPGDLRRRWLDIGYRELDVTGEHAVAIGQLPLIHRNPFDRMLVTQAKVEGLDFYTSDAQLSRYGDPVRYFS